MMLRIKKLTPEDTDLLKACAELEKLCLPEEAWSFASFLSETEKSSGYVLTAFNQNHEVIGFLTASCILDTGDLTNIVVSPDYRRNGIGRMLLDDLFSRTGNINLFLEVRESNPAREFYQKYGFKSVGIRKNFYQNPEENAILMQYGGI